MTRVLKLRPMAKINLTLRVGRAREDGFHDVQTILQTIALSDTLTLTPKRGPFALSAGSSTVAADQTNLVWRAADALWRAAGRAGGARDVQIALDKKIPVAAGLGGGSADAAATLAGLNVVWKIGMSRHDLIQVASSLGSDVPFFLGGGTALGLGRGEQIFPLQELPRLGVVIIKPSFGVSTADAYRWLDADRAAGIAEPARPAGHLDVGWRSGPVALINDLEAPVRQRHPGLAEAIDACLREGAKAAGMTGSGSAVFGLFSGAMAARAARRLTRPDRLVIPTRTVSRAESGRLMGL